MKVEFIRFGAFSFGAIKSDFFHDSVIKKGLVLRGLNVKFSLLRVLFLFLLKWCLYSEKCLFI